MSEIIPQATKKGKETRSRVIDIEIFTIAKLQ